MKPGFIRIIAGKWRGKRILIPQNVDLRPTPDRVRETLFNWLMGKITNAYCLDMFAGTGALGFEALSRGAGFVLFADNSVKVTDALKKTITELNIDNAKVIKATMPAVSTEYQFDIAFLDPPYQAELLLKACHYLEAKKLLNNPAYIYLESDQVIEAENLPENWQLIKKARAGKVYYHLAKRTIA